MAKIKIEVTSENQGDGKGIIAREIWSHLSALSGVHHALIDENTDEHVVELDFDVIAYSERENEMSEHTETGVLVERLRRAVDNARNYKTPYAVNHIINTAVDAATTIKALSAALASERAAHAAKDAEIARLTAEKDAAEFAARNSKSLDGDALHAVRALLDSAGVPKAAFIDDHVGNAIAQRDAERAAHAETKRALDEAIKAAGDQATLRGEAEGKLAASEMAGIVDGWKRRAEAYRTQLDEALKALEPLARLEIPAKPQGNAGAYSIFHDSIRAARRVREGGKNDG